MMVLCLVDGAMEGGVWMDRTLKVMYLGIHIKNRFTSKQKLIYSEISSTYFPHVEDATWNGRECNEERVVMMFDTTTIVDK